MGQQPNSRFKVCMCVYVCEKQYLTRPSIVTAISLYKWDGDQIKGSRCTRVCV